MHVYFRCIFYVALFVKNMPLFCFRINKLWWLGELLLNLVPLLPGGIMVYSVTQLLDYFKVSFVLKFEKWAKTILLSRKKSIYYAKY